MWYPVKHEHQLKWSEITKVWYFAAVIVECWLQWLNIARHFAQHCCCWAKYESRLNSTKIPHIIYSSGIMGCFSWLFGRTNIMLLKCLTAHGIIVILSTHMAIHGLFMAGGCGRPAHSSCMALLGINHPHTKRDTPLTALDHVTVTGFRLMVLLCVCLFNGV